MYKQIINNKYLLIRLNALGIEQKFPRVWFELIVFNFKFFVIDLGKNFKNFYLDIRILGIGFDYDGYSNMDKKPNYKPKFYLFDCVLISLVILVRSSGNFGIEYFLMFYLLLVLIGKFLIFLMIR